MLMTWYFHFRRPLLGFIFDFQYKNRDEKMTSKDFLTAFVCISLLGTFSEGAKTWFGESVVIAVQGESVTLTWNVSLTDSDANKTWTSVKILHAEGANTDELVTLKRTGEKLIDNSNYSSRRSDMTFNVFQSGPVVTIRFTMANLVRSTDMKNYKAVLGFTSDASTYPSVTTLRVLVRPHSTEFTIKPLKNRFCIGDQVNLTCKADAIPPAQISLFLNNHLVQNGNTSVTLFLTLNVKGEKNNFICVPKNTAGTGQTRDLKLLVKEPPKIARCWINGKQVQSKSFNEGTKVTLSCDLTGSEPLDVAWNKVNEQNSLSQTNTLTLNSIQRGQSGQYRVTVYGPECEKKVAKILYVGVMYLDRPAVHGNTYEVVSSKDPKAEFKVTIDGNPQPSVTCDREGGPGNVSVIVSATSRTKSTFLVRIYAINDEEYNCNVKSAAGGRHLKLKVYKQIPTAVINGTFTLKDKTWRDDLYRTSSDAYLGLKTKVTRALNLVYGNEKFVSQWRVLGFVKGSVAVNFQLDVIANVTDPIVLLKNAVEKNGGQLNGLSINSNSIKTGYSVAYKDAETDAKSVESKDNTGTHVGIGVGVTSAIVVLVFLAKRFCCNKNPRPSEAVVIYDPSATPTDGGDMMELEDLELKREYPNGIIDIIKAKKAKVPMKEAPKLLQGFASQQNSTTPQLMYSEELEELSLESLPLQEEWQSEML